MERVTEGCVVGGPDAGHAEPPPLQPEDDHALQPPRSEAGLAQTNIRYLESKRAAGG